MPEVSTLLSDEDVKNLDELIEKGMFKSREEIVLKSIKFLSSQSVEDIKQMNKGELIVDDFLLDNIGDMTYADTPVIEIWNGRKVFKYPVKTEYKKITLGYICVDPVNTTIIDELSDSIEKMKKNCENIPTDLSA